MRWRRVLDVLSKYGEANNVTAAAATLPTTAPVGATLLIYAYTKSSATSVSFTTGSNAFSGTPSLVGAAATPGTGYYMWVYSAIAAAGTTVQGTFNASGDQEVQIVVLAGNNTKSPVANNKNNVSNGTAGTAATATLTSPSAANGEFVAIGTAGDSGTWGTTPTGWSVLGTDNSNGQRYGMASYPTGSAVTSKGFSYRTSENWATIAVEMNHS